MKNKRIKISISILCLAIVWCLLYLAKSPYYIIDINDWKYLRWCNSEWLTSPEDFCILSLYWDNSRVGWGNDNSWTMYISPASFETVIDWNLVYKYCNGLNLWNVVWEAPLSHDASWSDMVKAQKMIYNLTAEWSTKPNHYWADIRSEQVDTRNNCRLDWACGSERSNTPLSVRCIAREKPKLKMSLKNIKINFKQYINKLSK